VPPPSCAPEAGLSVVYDQSPLLLAFLTRSAPRLIVHGVAPCNTATDVPRELERSEGWAGRACLAVVCTSRCPFCSQPAESTGTGLCRPHKAAQVHSRGGQDSTAAGFARRRSPALLPAQFAMSPADREWWHVSDGWVVGRVGNACCPLDLTHTHDTSVMGGESPRERESAPILNPNVPCPSSSGHGSAPRSHERNTGPRHALLGVVRRPCRTHLPAVHVQLMGGPHRARQGARAM
jgi:hypothetical protein